MATFEAKIHRIRVEPHPNADRLELAAIGGYRCIVAKGQYQSGDLAAYIPEGAVCPDWLIAELGLEGRLAGAKKNRVKAIKLRGILSQGLVYPVDGERLRVTPSGLQEGHDVTDLLELTKYEPPIPTHMQGEVANAFGYTLRYDIEDVKKWPDVLKEGERVHITEKIHGTWCCLGIHPDRGPIITSKGLSAKGLVFKLNEANENNLYVRAWEAYRDKFDLLRTYLAEGNSPIYVLGEIHGRGVQDLHYGEPKPVFRVFDMYVGHPGEGRYLSPNDTQVVACRLLPCVPHLYEGPFSTEIMEKLTSGPTVLGRHNIREGVVIRPFQERRHLELGRVILKSVSEAYLTRKPRKEKPHKKKARRDGLD